MDYIYYLWVLGHKIQHFVSSYYTFNNRKTRRKLDFKYEKGILFNTPWMVEIFEYLIGASIVSWNPSM